MAAVVLRIGLQLRRARAQRSEDQARAGAHDVGEPDDDERDAQLGAAADRDGEPGDRQRVPDGDQGRQHGDDGGAPAHRPHLRRDLEARDLDVLADEMAEAERGLARQARHAFCWTWGSSRRDSGGGRSRESFGRVLFAADHGVDGDVAAALGRLGERLVVGEDARVAGTRPASDVR